MWESILTYALVGCLLVLYWRLCEWNLSLLRSLEQSKRDLRAEEDETAQWVNTVQTEYRVYRCNSNWALSKNSKVIAIKPKLSEVLKQIHF
jgi:hypothetical protein